MKKIMCSLMAIAALSSISANAIAEWTIVDKNEEGVSLYADKNTIHKRKSGIVRMTSLDDFAAPSKIRGDNYISVVWIEEYDCKQVLHKIVSSVFYEERMGKGNIVVSFGATEGWDAAVPTSASHKLWKIACGMN